MNVLSKRSKIFPRILNKGIKKTRLRLLLLLIFTSMLLSASYLNAQSDAPAEDSTRTSFSIGIKGGYDFPLFKTPYDQLGYKGGRYLGAHMDLRFPSNLGIRLDYANIISRPNIKIPDVIYYSGIPSDVSKKTRKLKRHFVGIGPSYFFKFGKSNSGILIAPMIGYSWLKGGDAYAESPNPGSPPNIDAHLINTGFNTGALAAKGDLDFIIALGPKFKLTIGAYYLRHFGVHLDDVNDFTGNILTINHGENIFDNSGRNDPYTLINDPPNIVPIDPENTNCMDFPSIGAHIGISYTFGKRKPKSIVQQVEPPCSDCGCPNDGHRVVVTVRDELSNKIIPEADVAIRDLSGNIIATGTTNSYGVVDFGEIHHGNYTVSGSVYNIETSKVLMKEEEFTPNAVIQKEVLYKDVRFILKGKAVNKNTRNPEPNVVVTLTHNQTRNVNQDNSNGKGEFNFRLDKNSSYEIVGTKENKLSDIERASTIGLTRSTTLFVDLELGVDDFDCGQGTVLDIKYEFNKAIITPESKFELDRLVRYMNDHNIAKVELSSHTDCRGSDAYNKNLSKERAKAATKYIISRGIPISRINARGYGESRLLNRCSDGVDCSEEEHRVNRRTEAKLECR